MDGDWRGVWGSLGNCVSGTKQKSSVSDIDRAIVRNCISKKHEVLYPIVPSPSSSRNNKSSNNKAKPRETSEKYHVNTHPLSSFVKKEYIPDYDRRQDLSTTHRPRANNP
jgi:hypothetical protein